MNIKELVDGPLTAAILAGVSTRNYQKIIAHGIEAKGVSKSVVSRKAIAATKPTVDQFRNRKIDDLDLVVLFLDGVHIAKRQVVVCIGVDSGGKKHVLALRNGASENEIVCQDLIDDMKEKGLDTQRKYLFVIDGSKALAKVHQSFIWSRSHYSAGAKNTRFAMFRRTSLANIGTSAQQNDGRIQPKH